MRKLYRSRDDKILSGLLGGFAQMFSIDSSLLRLGFVVVTFITGYVPLALAYIIGSVIVPLAPTQEQSDTEEQSPTPEQPSSSD